MVATQWFSISAGNASNVGGTGPETRSPASDKSGSNTIASTDRLTPNAEADSQPVPKETKLVSPYMDDPYGRAMDISLADVSFCGDCSESYRQWIVVQIDKAAASGQAKSLQKSLATRLATNSSATLKTQIVDVDLSMALAQHELIRSVTSEEIDRILAAPKGIAFLKTFLGNRGWLEETLCSAWDVKIPGNNEQNHATPALKTLFKIWSHNPECAQHPVLRRLSTATALAFTQPFQKKSAHKSKETSLARYQFFRDSWAAGRLHRSFDELNIVEMRYLAAAQWDNDSLKWLQENIRLPLKKMGSACWAAEYRGGTIFGGSIHAPGFYEPWAKAMTYAENIYRHGGVCGSLSHLGAMSCSARGIPGVTVGQPGHCAYGFRVARGEWLGGFGGPHGGTGIALYGFNSTYRDMADEALVDFASTRKSRQHAWQAHVAMDTGSNQIASEAWDLSLNATPLAYESWLEVTLFKLTQSDNLTQGDNVDWNSWNNRLVDTFQKHPYVAFELLALYEDRIASDAEEKIRLWASIHKKVADHWLNPTWNDLAPTLHRQVQKLEMKTEGSMRIAEMILDATSQSEKTFAAAVGWAQKVFPENESGQKRWAALLARSLSNGVSGDQKAQTKLYNQAILAAASVESHESFQTLSRQAIKVCSIQPPQLPEFQPFPGENLSRGGVLRISSTSGWDNPCLHAGILDQGGACHTGREVRPYVEARLPKLSRLTGIVIINTGNRWRVVPLKVSVSEDGNDWTDVARLTERQTVYRIPISRRMRTRYIRVGRDDDREEHFHLQLINAFGRRLE